MTEEILIQVEVACAFPDRQSLLKIKVPQSCSALDAVHRSGILNRYPEIDANELKLGIFSKIVPPQTLLREGDRVEIYRPLIADPKAVRRQRAAEGKVLKKGGSNNE